MALLINPAEAAFIVVDTEGTGLSAREDHVMEVGVGVYDVYLNEIAMNSWLVNDGAWYERLKMNEYVLQMHTSSGLVSDIQGLPEFYYEANAEGRQQRLDFSRNMVSLQILQWLRDSCGIEPGKFPMTGSSIGSYDRPVWKNQLPVAESFFSHRNIDVSSVKELCKKFNPKLYAEMSAMPEFQSTNKQHRVRDDIRATVRELDFYFNHFLVVDLPSVVQGQIPLLDHPA